jgi:BMFP domain-containing protein YqiC
MREYIDGNGPMTDTTTRPLDSLLSRLREALGELAPEPLLNRMKPVLEGFLAQFQLVPKREYDAHMAALKRLEATVTDLERRIAELERHD